MKQAIIVLYVLAFGNMVFGLTQTPTIGAISETTIGAISESTQGPIWFARAPELTYAAEHQTEYLMCKQAHGGQSRWVDNTADCRKCFCLPDTRQIGCTKCSESERRMHKRTGPMGQRKAEHSNNGAGLYVNREACVRANSGRVFTRGCTHCVCRQNGSVLCVPIVPCKKVPRHISANNISADRILVDRFVREQTFGSFSKCVQAHGGHSSFKSDCNTCSCTETGTVVCTLKACIDESHHEKPDTHSSYAKCVKDNGSSTFKQKCNVCMCLQDGHIACTKKLCLS